MSPTAFEPKEIRRVAVLQGFLHAWWLYAYPGDRVALRRLALKQGLPWPE